MQHHETKNLNCANIMCACEFDLHGFAQNVPSILRPAFN
jgi:hypothetical protein